MATVSAHWPLLWDVVHLPPLKEEHVFHRYSRFDRLPQNWVSARQLEARGWTDMAITLLAQEERAPFKVQGEASYGSRSFRTSFRRYYFDLGKPGEARDARIAKLHLEVSQRLEHLERAVLVERTLQADKQL